MSEEKSNRQSEFWDAYIHAIKVASARLAPPEEKTKLEEALDAANGAIMNVFIAILKGIVSALEIVTRWPALFTVAFFLVFVVVCLVTALAPVR